MNRADIAAGCMWRGITTVSVFEGEGHVVDKDVQEVTLEEADAPREDENICFPVYGFHFYKCESALDDSELSVQDVHLV